MFLVIVTHWLLKTWQCQVVNTKEGLFYFISLTNEYFFSSWRK